MAKICGTEGYICPIKLEKREEYNLRADFPHICAEIENLHDFVKGQTPESIYQMWFDRRNPVAWIAYWSVVVIGVVGILLALIQTVFQILQFTQGFYS